MTAESVDAAITATSSKRDLSYSTKRLINGEYGDKTISQVLMSVIHGMIAAGSDLDEISTYFRTRDVALVRDARLHYRYGLQTEIETAFGLAKSSRTTHRVNCGVARRMVIDSWQGSDGTAFRTLLGLYNIAQKAGSFEFTASRRTVAEAAGVGGVSATGASYTTAANAVGRLHEAGLISFKKRPRQVGELNATSGYRLHTPEGLQIILSGPKRSTIPIAELQHSPAPTALPDGRLCTPKNKNSGTKWAPIVRSSASYFHVVWEPVALGPNPCRVWHLVSENSEAWSVKRIAELVCIPARTVRKILSRLIDAGLVVVVKDGTFEAVDVDLDQLAIELGVSERSATRARLNDEQRRGRERFLNRPRATGQPAASVASIIDPFTGEIFTAENIAAIVTAATAMLGGTAASVEVAA